MPELPEIESTVQTLAPMVVGARMHKVSLQSSRLARTADVECMQDVRCERILRWGKYLIMQFDNKKSLVFHFGMSGFMYTSNYPQRNHTRAVMPFDVFNLYFDDQRNFGKLYVVDTEVLHKQSYLSKLGPDALSMAFSPQYLYKKCNVSFDNIKAIIMDQTVVAGIGNIYANESLYASFIRPDRLGVNISYADCEALVDNIKEILKFYTERDMDGWSHASVNHQVYGRKGLMCPKCGDIFTKYELNGRGTYICPTCQKE